MSLKLSIIARADHFQSENSTDATEAVDDIQVEHCSGNADESQSETPTNFTHAVNDIQVQHF